MWRIFLLSGEQELQYLQMKYHDVWNLFSNSWAVTHMHTKKQSKCAKPVTPGDPEKILDSTEY